MKITEYTKEGKQERELTVPELKEFAKEGSLEAIRELIKLKGGWDALSQEQKDKVMQISLGFAVDF